MTADTSPAMGITSKTPEPAPSVSAAQAQGLMAYADPWTTPPEAFFDIYDLLPRMIEPRVHLQLDGRRGTGKTVLMVNSYLRVRQQFEATRGSPPYNVGIYIDLSQDVGVSRDQLPLTRGVALFQQILRLVLTASSRPGHRRDRRFWGLQDYLEERPHWFRRLIGRWRLERYRSFVERLCDDLYAHPLFKHIYDAQRGLYTPAPRLKPVRVAASAQPAQTRVLPASIRQHRGLPSLVYEKRLVDLYRQYGYKLGDVLDPMLDAMQVQHLILYLDEWSGPSVGSDTQSYLFEQLAHSFKAGGRVTLKFATVPGATRLAFDSSPTQLPVVHLDNLAAFQPHWLRRRLMRMLILNLNASVGKGFPLQRYLSDNQEQAGFPAFINDVFQNEDGADELIQASEGLPRQMLLLFMAALQLQSLYASRKRLSAAMIRMAARQLFATQYETTISHDQVVKEVFGRMAMAGRRIVDVERVPLFYDALDWLVNEGVVYRCASTGSSPASMADTGVPSTAETPQAATEPPAGAPASTAETSQAVPVPPAGEAQPAPASAPALAAAALERVGDALAQPQTTRPLEVESLIRYKLSYPAEVHRLSSQQTALTPAWFETLRVEQVTDCERYQDPPRVNLAELSSDLFETGKG